MKLVRDEDAWDDYEWWLGPDHRIVRRVNALVNDITRNGNEGMGKPER